MLKCLKPIMIIAATAVLAPTTAIAQQGPPAQRAAPPSDDAMPQACGPDVQQLCAGVRPGQGRIVRCLQSRRSEVSEGCRLFLQTQISPTQGPPPAATQAPPPDQPPRKTTTRRTPPGASPPDATQAPPPDQPPRLDARDRRSPSGPGGSLRAACHDDRVKLCSNTRSFNQIIQCLSSRQSELSDSCRTYIDQNQAGRPGPAARRRPPQKQ